VGWCFLDFKIGGTNVLTTEAECNSQIKTAAKEQDDREIREAYVLGKMLYYQEDYEVAKNQVSVDDFSGLHRLLFTMICSLYGRGEEPNFDNLVEMCEESGLGDIDEMCRRITTMLACADDPRGIQYYVDKLKHDSPLLCSPLAGASNYSSSCQDGNIHKYMAEGHGAHCPDLNVERPLSGTIRGTPQGQEKSLAERVKEYVEDTHGWFSRSQLDKELGICSSQEKDNRKHVLARLCQTKMIERHPDKDGWYRFVKSNVQWVDLRTVSQGASNLKLPLGIDQYVTLHPGNLIVVAGVSNVGKTAFLMNILHDNLVQWSNRIAYFCSEMGEEEFRSRCDRFPFSNTDFDRFRFAVHESVHFSDVIVPDWLNFVDFLEVNQEFWLMGDYLSEIQKKVGKGLAVVAIQMTPGKELGIGGAFSKARSRLYLTMREGTNPPRSILTIAKAKSWKGSTNPNRMAATFTISNGCRFTVGLPLGHHPSHLV